MTNHEITLLRETVHEKGRKAQEILDAAKATFKEYGFVGATHGICNMLETVKMACMLIDSMVDPGMGDLGMGELMQVALVKWLSEVQLEVCDEKLMKMN